jgi:hypothetical protein
MLASVIPAGSPEDVLHGGVLLAVRELDTVIGEYGVDGVGDGRDEVAQECGGDQLGGPRVQFDIGELGSPIDGHELIEFALGGLNFGNVDVEIADRVALELLPVGLVAVHVRQPADPMPLQTATQRRPRQMRDRRLQSLETIVQGSNVWRRKATMIASPSIDRLSVRLRTNFASSSE